MGEAALLMDKLKYIMGIDGLIKLMSGLRDEPLDRATVAQIADISFDTNKPQKNKLLVSRCLGMLKSFVQKYKGSPLYSWLLIEDNLETLRLADEALNSELNAALENANNYKLHIFSGFQQNLSRLLNFSDAELTFDAFGKKPASLLSGTLYQIVGLMLISNSFAYISACGVLNHDRQHATRLSDISNDLLPLSDLINIMVEEIVVINQTSSQVSTLLMSFFEYNKNFRQTPQLDFQFAELLWYLLFGYPTKVSIVKATDQTLLRVRYNYFRLQDFLHDQFSKPLKNFQINILYRVPHDNITVRSSNIRRNPHHWQPFNDVWKITNNPRLLGLEFIQRYFETYSDIKNVLSTGITVLCAYLFSRAISLTKLQELLSRYSNIVNAHLQSVSQMAYCLGAAVPIEIYLANHYVNRSLINSLVIKGFPDDWMNIYMAALVNPSKVSGAWAFYKSINSVAQKKQPQQMTVRQEIPALVEQLQALPDAQCVVLNAPCPGLLIDGKWVCAATPINSGGWGGCRLLSFFATFYNHIRNNSRFGTPFEFLADEFAASLPDELVNFYHLKSPFVRNDTNKFLDNLVDLMICCSSVLLYRTLVANHKCFAEGDVTPQRCQQVTQRFIQNMMLNNEYLRYELTRELDDSIERNRRYWLGDVWQTNDGFERYALCLNLFRLIMVIMWTSWGSAADATLNFMTNDSINNLQRTEMFWLACQSLNISNRSITSLHYIFKIIFIKLRSPFTSNSIFDVLKANISHIFGADKNLINYLTMARGAHLEVYLSNLLRKGRSADKPFLFTALYPNFSGMRLPTDDNYLESDYSHTPMIISEDKDVALLNSFPNHEVIFGFSYEGHAAILYTHPGVDARKLFLKVIRPYSGLVVYWMTLIMNRNVNGITELNDTIQRLDLNTLEQHISSGLANLATFFKAGMAEEMSNLHDVFMSAQYSPMPMSKTEVRKSLGQTQILTKQFELMTLSNSYSQLAAQLQDVYDINPQVIVDGLALITSVEKLAQNIPLRKLLQTNVNFIDICRVAMIKLLSLYHTSLMYIVYQSNKRQLEESWFNLNSITTSDIPVMTYVNLLVHMMFVIAHHDLFTTFIKQSFNGYISRSTKKDLSFQLFDRDVYPTLVQLYERQMSVTDPPEFLAQLASPDNYLSLKQHLSMDFKTFQILLGFMTLRTQRQLWGALADFYVGMYGRPTATEKLADIVTMLDNKIMMQQFSELVLYLIDLKTSSIVAYHNVVKPNSQLFVDPQRMRESYVWLFSLKSNDEHLYTVHLRNVFNKLTIPDINTVRASVIRFIMVLGWSWHMYQEDFFRSSFGMLHNYLYCHLLFEFFLQEYLALSSMETALDDVINSSEIGSQTLLNAIYQDFQESTMLVAYNLACSIPNDFKNTCFIDIYKSFSLAPSTPANIM